ncbi:MAG TPA: hypothetical protein VJ812_12430 [Gemmatimonadaceae bacterium]|jgi:CheY-like chemotaxis protein|nr:hypothetical protein [Gemmatimonadaceae bacterium]
MRAVCIARHRYLSEHVCSVFGAMDMETFPAVGFPDGMELARSRRPNVVFCDYDLLSTAPLEEWAADPQLQDTPIIAVSLTRKHDEAQHFEGNGAAGFLYLPTLTASDAASVLRAVVRGITPPTHAMRWSSQAHEPRLAD